jgi:hypothetical protein
MKRFSEINKYPRRVYDAAAPRQTPGARVSAKAEPQSEPPAKTSRLRWGFFVLAVCAVAGVTALWQARDPSSVLGEALSTSGTPSSAVTRLELHHTGVEWNEASYQQKLDFSARMAKTFSDLHHDKLWYCKMLNLAYGDGEELRLQHTLWEAVVVGLYTAGDIDYQTFKDFTEDQPQSP